MIVELPGHQLLSTLIENWFVVECKPTFDRLIHCMKVALLTFSLPYFFLYHSIFQYLCNESPPYYVPKSQRWHQWAWMRKWVRYKWKWALTCSKAPFDDTAAARRRAALKLRHQIRALEGRRYRGWHLRRIVRGLPKQVQRAILVNHAVAYSAKSPFGDSSARWDSDSMAVGMDNRCSACISDKVEHFEDLRPCDRIIKGFRGTRTTNVMIGTLK